MRGRREIELGANPDEHSASATGAEEVPLITWVLLDGRDVSEEIRSPEVSEAASRVAADAGVRAALVAKQRALIAGGDWVAEGRDIGTVVAPEAELKVYLTPIRPRSARAGARPSSAPTTDACSPSRRCATSATASRAHSPLAAAPGGGPLDTSGLHGRGGRCADRDAGTRIARSERRSAPAGTRDRSAPRSY